LLEKLESLLVDQKLLIK